METDHQEEAFTLVELIVVVGIVGILASLIAPQIGGSISAWRSTRYAQSLWSSLRNAKFQAVSKDRTVVVRFKLDGRQKVRFFISKTEHPENFSPAPSLYPMTLPPKVEIASVGTADPDDDAGYNCIQFNSDGDVTDVWAVSSTEQGCRDKGTAVGNPYIHIAPEGVDLTSANECVVSSIIINNTNPSPQPYLVNYGAEDEFTNTLGDDPCS